MGFQGDKIRARAGLFQDSFRGLVIADDLQLDAAPLLP